MADITDVTNALVDIATAAAYPNGTGSSSVSGGPISIFEGWPKPGAVDEAMAAGQALCSVFPVPGTTSDPGQAFDWNPGVLIAPVHGVAASLAGTVLTLSGTPGAGEYVSIILDGLNAYSRTGVDVSTIAAALVADIVVDYPSATNVGGVLTLAGAQIIVVRIGAPATVAERIYRQRQQVRVTVWAPNPAIRTAVGVPIDLAIKQNLTITLPDTSRAIITWQGVNISDEKETVDVYRRDHTVFAQWDTFSEFPAYEITVVDTTINEDAAAV